VVESVTEVSILKIVLLSARLQQLTASLLVVATSVHGEVNGLPDEQMTENFPSTLLDLFGQEIFNSTVIMV
jgi:hypothetical protein